MTTPVASSTPRFLTVTPHFTVPDVVAAAAYYGDVLGCENRGFFGDPPVFVMLARVRWSSSSIRVRMSPA